MDSLPFLIIIITTTTIIILHCPSSIHGNQRYMKCNTTFKCGDIDGIGYPFWGSDRPNYCGFPGFELNCSTGDNQSPEITIVNQTYKVDNINNSSYLLRLSRADYASGLCPASLKNTTFVDSLFSLTSDTEPLNLYYGCQSAPAQLNMTSSPFQFTCDVIGPTSTSFYVSGNTSSFSGNVLEFYHYLEGGCSGRVYIPVTQSRSTQIMATPSADTVLSAIREGFELNWNANNSLCESCRDSGGVCGYDTWRNMFNCHCPDQTYLDICQGHQTNPSGVVAATFIIVGAATFISVTISALLICVNISCIKRKVPLKNDQELEAIINDYGPLPLKRYTFSDVKNMTCSFKEKLGQGGYGSVYKGKQHDGRLVAVKVLNTTKGKGEDFLNEVLSISRTSHVNIVTLLGFCLEGSKRALIYEFVSNGSLEKFIHNKSNTNADHHCLGWENLHRISIEIAQGLEYLHRGCTTRILHFDIKPHNILLNEDFCPKISDFGLAKLCTKKESIVSIIETRGTIGYIAPELYNRNCGRVSHKSDVYSYGMMILEMVGAKNNPNIGGQNSSETYFPDWIYKRLKEEGDLGLSVGVMTDLEDEAARKMVLVGLWCMQTDPSQRPNVSEVLDMLKGSIDNLQIPPRPFAASPPRSLLLDSFSSSVL